MHVNRKHLWPIVVMSADAPERHGLELPTGAVAGTSSSSTELSFGPKMLEQLQVGR